MGIPISGASDIHGDNMLVIHNTSKPEWTLKKKCNAIACHVVCKSVTMGESLTGHIRSEGNTANLLTKIVTGHKRKHILLLVL